ncbi:hypothetical protein [Dyella agri]|uniref:Uncharacterized protein n=1 Tax=Dyella agri TaxID=1926869 RepID=A0ABW8KAY1_9GAMM
MAIESVATAQPNDSNDSNGAGFAFIPRINQHLFRVPKDAPQDALLGHLSCMLAGMRKITNDCDGGLEDEYVWILNALAEQAEAIVDSLELRSTPPRRNGLGSILADAATLPDADMAVLVSLLRGMRNGMDMDPDSLRSASDADVRRLADRDAPWAVAAQ